MSKQTTVAKLTHNEVLTKEHILWIKDHPLQFNPIVLINDNVYAFKTWETSDLKIAKFFETTPIKAVMTPTSVIGSLITTMIGILVVGMLSVFVFDGDLTQTLFLLSCVLVGSGVGGLIRQYLYRRHMRKVDADNRMCAEVAEALRLIYINVLETALSHNLMGHSIVGKDRERLPHPISPIYWGYTGRRYIELLWGSRTTPQVYRVSSEVETLPDRNVPKELTVQPYYRHQHIHTISFRDWQDQQRKLVKRTSRGKKQHNKQRRGYR